MLLGHALTGTFAKRRGKIVLARCHEVGPTSGAGQQHQSGQVRSESALPSGAAGLTCSPGEISKRISARNSALPQVFEPQQHGEHPFQLPIEVDFVATEPI